MIKDFSFGIIPLCCEEGIWNVFLVQHKQGHWCFPKGHPHDLELPLETAKRELFEETGLTVDTLLIDQPIFEEYTFSMKDEIIAKKVGYFIAIVQGSVQLQKEELLAGRWVHIAIADQHITHEEGRELMRKVEQIIHWREINEGHYSQ